jgi:hypothetical protein
MFLLVTCLRAVWHHPVIQALWVALRYPPGSDPSKVRIHVSKRRRRQWDAEARAQRTRQHALERAALNEFIPHVSTYGGIPNTTGMSLAAGEWIVARITDTGLIEDVSSGGSWIGGTNTLSIPVGHHGFRLGHGRSVGTYVTAAPSPTITDAGITFITNRRVVFQGHSQTRQCRFEDLIGFTVTPDADGVSVSVANRMEPVRISFGTHLGQWFSVRLRFALAEFRGDRAAFLRELQNRLGHLSGAGARMS